MTPAVHPLGEHLPGCNSPENCAEYASILTMSPAEQCAWITKDRASIAGLRTASSSRRTFRVSQPENFTPPDAYAADIAKRHTDEATPMTRFEKQHAADRLAAYTAEYSRADADRAARQPAPITDTTDYTPPDSYQIALDARKENSR